MIVKVNGIEVGYVITNKSLTIEEAMYCIGYDIYDQSDCKKGYDEGVEGFCFDDCGVYYFDVEAADMVY